MASSLDAKGGNITFCNFTDQTLQTGKWQGYFGNVSGRVSLRDSSGYFLNWSWSPVDTANAGSIIATTNTSPNWSRASSLATTTAGAINTTWGFGNASDDANHTFNDAATIIEIAGKSIIDALTAETHEANGTVTEFWKTCAVQGLRDGSANNVDDFLFAGIIDSTGTARSYRNTTANYQMLVPTYQNATTMTYIFYIELK